MADNREKKMAIYCEVCTEQFSKEKYIPRMLKCGHTFCECCLEKLKTKEYLPLPIAYNVGRTRTGLRLGESLKICCPTCKAKTVLASTTDTAKSLPKNFIYLDLLQDVLDHTLNLIQKETCCDTHPNYVLDHFCHDEEEAVCLKCTVYGQHKSHQVSKLSDISDHKRTAIEYNTSCLNDMIEQCQDLKDHLEERKSHIEMKVDEIRRRICRRFSLVQEKIKATLDAKLEQVMDKFSEMHTVQSTILERNDLEIAKGIEELEELRDESNDFLSQASQCDIAKEKDLITDVEMCLDKVKDYELTTTHTYEVKIDGTNQMLEVIKEIVGAWVCEVHTPELDTNTVGTIQETYSSKCFSKSLRVLFDEEQPSDEQCQNPFETIRCEWCPGTFEEGQPSDELNEDGGQSSHELYVNEEQLSVETNEDEGRPRDEMNEDEMTLRCLAALSEIETSDEMDDYYSSD